MTVAADTPSFIQIPGNGTATSFAFPFKIFQASDLIVGFITATGYGQQTSGFTVTNVDVNGGGNVVFTTPPSSSVTVDIRSLTPKIQNTEFANLGSFLPEAHTEAFDRLTRTVQDLYRLAYTFGVHGPDQEGTAWTALPVASQRKNNALMFDSNGLPTIGTLVSQALTQSLIGQFLYPQTAAEIAAGVTPTNYAYAPYNILRYGADPAGVAAADTAIQNAINAAPAGAEVFIPDGTYKIATGLTITNKNHLRIHGKGVLDMSGAGSNAICFQPVGTCDDVTLEGFSIQGATNNTYFQEGVGMNGGQTITRLRCLNLKIDGTNVGISFNALNGVPAPSGSVMYSEIRGCIISNCRGTGAGQGYGIHLGNPQYCSVVQNHVDNASRHSIYHAWGGDNLIMGNIASNHRLTEHDGVSIKCSFVISRSNRVLFVGNKDINGYDGCLEISHDTSTGQNASDIQVIGCEFSNMQNNVFPVIIGEQLEPTTVMLEHAFISGCKFSADYGKLSTNNFIQIFNGRYITIKGNYFHITNVAGTAKAIYVGEAIYNANPSDCTNIVITGNHFAFEGSVLTDTEAIVLESTGCTNTSTNILAPNTGINVSAPVRFITSPPTNVNILREDWTQSLTVTLPAGSQTFNTAAYHRFAIGGTAGGSTVTNFTGGYEGKEIEFYCQDANVTFSNANFYTSGGTSFVSSVHSIIRFRQISGSWVEIGRMVY